MIKNTIKNLHKQSLVSLFENSSIGIIVVNNLGDIVEINPFASMLFCYKRDELIGKKIEILIPQKIRNEHIDLRNNYFKTPLNRPMGSGLNLQACKKDGTFFNVEISLSHYQVEDKQFAVSFINDVTQRVKLHEQVQEQTRDLEEKIKNRTSELSKTLGELEELNSTLLNEVRQREQIEEQVRKALKKEKELNELKSRFVSMASHEFRTPLSGIMNSASLISKYTKDNQQDKRDRHIRTIKKSVRNLTVILNDFLSLDKLEHNMLQITPFDFSIDEFLISFIEEFSDLLRGNQKLELICEEQITIHQDQDILRNIMMNLVSNAVKYSHDNDTILIKLQTQNENIILEVEDHGPGIPFDDQHHLFERFFRASNVSTVQGTGLGLNIVKKYLELLQGKIEFNSLPNTKTIFRIIFPQRFKNDN